MPDLLVAIHQPCFFPWTGYFNKIKSADRFVILDDVLVIKTGSSWFNRVMIPNFESSDGMWMTVPIRRPSGTQSISEVEVVDFTLWREKFFKTLQSRYAKHPFQKETLDLVSSLIPSSEQKLSDLNTGVIEKISRVLDLSKVEFMKASQLKVESEGTQRLVDLTKAVGGQTYLCGGGSTEYFEEALFNQSSLAVRYQNFRPLEYPQLGASQFIPGMSVIDLLMNVGLEAARDFI